MIRYWLAQVIWTAAQVLSWLIIIDAILSWFPNARRHPIGVLLHRITEPIYRPIRRLIPPEKTGYIDLSPIIAILGLYVIRAILIRIILI